MLVILTNTHQNAFSDRLGHLGFNIFCALIIDLLHEFEIGIWKMLFIQLLRIWMHKTKGSSMNWTGGTLLAYVSFTLLTP
jgi:hypothetical protein